MSGSTCKEADLSAIRCDARKAANGTEFLEWLLLDREWPPLNLPYAEDNEANRFIYSARRPPPAARRVPRAACRVQLRGRETEMNQLSAFLDAKETFLWAAWTAPAGVGKSRLAIEFCDRAAEAGWEVGFHNWNVPRKPTWDKWSPRLPKLVVFYYAQEHAPKIAAAMLSSEALLAANRLRLQERSTGSTGNNHSPCGRRTVCIHRLRRRTVANMPMMTRPLVVGAGI